MRYQPDHKPRARERIIKAARAVFAQVGFDRATIDDVMAEADMTRGGFYKHFDNKEALLVEVVRDGQVEVPEEVSCTVEDMLARYVDDAHLDNKHDACPLFTFPNDVAHCGDEVKVAYEDVARSIAGVLTTALPDKDGETAMALMAMSVGCMVVANSCSDPDFQRAVREATLKHIAKLAKDHSN